MSEQVTVLHPFSYKESVFIAGSVDSYQFSYLGGIYETSSINLLFLTYFASPAPLKTPERVPSFYRAICGKLARKDLSCGDMNISH
jgi:hypothetical protein